MKPVQDTDTDRIFLQLQRELLRMGLAEGTGGQPVRRLLRGQGFCMELPEDFRETDRDRAAALFYSRHRPETMVLCPKRCAGFTFQALEAEADLPVDDMEKAGNTAREVLRRADVKTVFYEQGQALAGRVHWFDYKSFAKDGAVYNLMFLFPAETKVMMGTFYCRFRDYDRWKTEVLKLLETIRIGEGDTK